MKLGEMHRYSLDIEKGWPVAKLDPTGPLIFLVDAQAKSLSDERRIADLEAALKEAVEWIEHADEDAWGYAGHNLPGGPWPLRNEVASKMRAALRVETQETGK